MATMATTATTAPAPCDSSPGDTDGRRQLDSGQRNGEVKRVNVHAAEDLIASLVNSHLRAHQSSSLEYSTSSCILQVSPAHHQHEG